MNEDDYNLSQQKKNETQHIADVRTCRPLCGADRRYLVSFPGQVLLSGAKLWCEECRRLHHKQEPLLKNPRSEAKVLHLLNSEASVFCGQVSNVEARLPGVGLPEGFTQYCQPCLDAMNRAEKTPGQQEWVENRRREFESGSVRDNSDGKGRFDLVSPHAMRRLALVLQHGAKKYAPRNWEKGQPIGASYLDSALRHIFAYMAQRRDEDHLAQAMWNLHAAIHTEELCLLGRLPEKLLDIGVYAIIGVNPDHREYWHSTPRKPEGGTPGQRPLSRGDEPHSLVHDPRHDNGELPKPSPCTYQTSSGGCVKSAGHTDDHAYEKPRDPNGYNLCGRCGMYHYPDHPACEPRETISRDPRCR